jgi:hypothetical protein
VRIAASGDGEEAVTINLRMAYRIASMPAALPHPSTFSVEIDMDVLKQRCALQARHIRAAPLLVLDNVAEYYASHNRQEWADTDVPNWAPPFGSFFAEWVEPSTWNMPEGLVTRSDAGQVGFLVLAMNVTDDTRTDLDRWFHWFGRILGLAEGVPWNPGEPMLGRVRAAFASARWVLYAELWTTTSCRPLCGRPLWSGVEYFLFIGPDGALLDKFATGPTLEFSLQTGGVNTVWSPLNVLGLGLSFSHCKNVTRTEEADDRGPRWHRRSGVPVLKFHRLDIRPMREVLRREGRSEEQGLARALHICRGHFATYTDERPLFGKVAGTFWVPAHVRGTAAAGKVVKEYAVHPG